MTYAISFSNFHKHADKSVYLSESLQGDFYRITDSGNK